jgi:hypothetical protein
MAGNEFFLTREPAGNQRSHEHLHFATHLNRTLTLEEGARLRDVLTELLGDAPKPPAKAVEVTEEPKAAETAAPKGKLWGKGKNAE